MVNTSAIPRKNPATSFRVIEGQALVMQAEGAQVHVLNEVGTRVWGLLDGKRTVEEIIGLVKEQLLAEDYEQFPANLAADVTGFVDDLEKRGIVVMVEKV